MTIALAIVLGLAAGVLAGLFGVGGGILFVPTLVLGVASAASAQGGAAVAHLLGGVTLRRLFALFLVVVAANIAWRARRT